jgi:hypothetical protein
MEELNMVYNNNGSNVVRKKVYIPRLALTDNEVLQFLVVNNLN